mgnify:CR=1 FL=1
MLSSSNKSNALSFITSISLINTSIFRASSNEHIPKTFPVFRFSAQSNSTHKKFGCIVGFQISIVFALFLQASDVKKEHALKLKTFARQTPFSIQWRHPSRKNVRGFSALVFISSVCLKHFVCTVVTKQRRVNSYNADGISRQIKIKLK